MRSFSGTESPLMSKMQSAGNRSSIGLGFSSSEGSKPLVPLASKIQRGTHVPVSPYGGEVARELGAVCEEKLCLGICPLVVMERAVGDRAWLREAKD